MITLRATNFGHLVVGMGRAFPKVVGPLDIS